MGWNKKERSKHIHEFREYVDFYEQFFFWQAVINFCVVITIVAYLSINLYKRRELTLFTWLMLTLLLITQVMDMTYELSYNVESYDNCELNLLLVKSIVYISWTNVSLMISYQYFYCANTIYRFAQNSVLPNNQS